MDFKKADGKVLTRTLLFDVWQNSKKENHIDKISTYILEFHGVSDINKCDLTTLKKSISRICAEFKKKWEATSRHRLNFLKENKNWLEQQIHLPCINTTSSSKINDKKFGRPKKNFKSCTVKVQKRKVREILKEKSPEAIALAAEMSVRLAGKRDAADLIKELSTSSPKRATNLKKARKLFVETPHSYQMTPERALALIVNNKLTTQQYKNIRKETQIIPSSKSVFPPYHLVKEVKKTCYPPEESIVITEYSAEINLQDLLNLTCKRIIKLQEEVLNSLSDIQEKKFVLICKWGCDGSSGQSRYKQQIDTKYNDEYLFTISFVPLRLNAIDNMGSTEIIWKNSRPSSTRYCRMIKFSYEKETKDLIINETQKIKEKILKLTSVKVSLNNNRDIHVSYQMLLTMIDGKVCSALSQYQSSQCCFICGASPKDMNSNKASVVRKPSEKLYEFGLSPLHSYIRSFEFILHVAYKLGIKKWQARSPEEKIEVSNKKKELQHLLRQEMGLLVDLPKQTSGTTNDGNTARKFFKDPAVVAQITSIKEELIHHFKILLEAISSGYEIDEDKFEKYAEETKNIFLSEYSWYYMPASIHKILIHGKAIINACILPIGQLSEEAQEARNKDYKYFREHFTRKTSRRDTNRDILNRFLLTSDPVISQYQEHIPSKSKRFHPDTLNLLKSPDIKNADDSEFSDSD